MYATYTQIAICIAKTMPTNAYLLLNIMRSQRSIVSRKRPPNAKNGQIKWRRAQTSTDSKNNKQENAECTYKHRLHYSTKKDNAPNHTLTRVPGIN